MVLTVAAGSTAAWAVPSNPECVGDRYVGFTSGPAQCSGIDKNWKRTLLFPAGSPGDLARYCAYDWVGAGSPVVADLPLLTPGNAPARDCAAVTGHGTELESVEQPALEFAFRKQVESLASLPASRAAWTQTKVVIVDASATHGFPEPSGGLIDHGRAMGVIVRELSCGAGAPASCRAKVASSLALPLVRLGDALLRQPTGGYLGTFGDVARGIVAGYQAAATVAPTTAPIVLNLSVGWDSALGGAYPGDDYSTLAPPVRAVHDALAFVSCRGALVFAATGNASNGEDESSGPAYPAAWEAKPAPTAAGCGVVGGAAPGPAPITTYRRLVYAVGGVDARDYPLSNRRPDSTPSLVAQGDHATLTRAGSASTDVLTGSSVSSAVVAAAAATAWSYLPSTSAHDVVELVRGSALDLGVAPSLVPEACGAGGCPPHVRRISLCRAVAAACAPGNPLCPRAAVQCPSAALPRDARPTGLAFAVPGMVGVPQGPFGASIAIPAGSACTMDEYVVPAVAIGFVPVCPADTYPNAYARPYSGPQPGTSLCPTCELRENGDVVVALNPDFVGDIYSPVLLATYPDGTVKAYYLSVPDSELTPGNTFKVVGTPARADQVKSAEIQFKVVGSDESYSSTDPLILELP